MAPDFDEAAFRASLDRECDNDMRSALHMMRRGVMEPWPGTTVDCQSLGCGTSWKWDLFHQNCPTCYTKHTVDPSRSIFGAINGP